MSRASLEVGMLEELATLLRAEREAVEPISVPNSLKPHPIVVSWPEIKTSRRNASVASEKRRRRIATILFCEIENRGGTVSAYSGTRPHPHWIDQERFRVQFLGATIDVALKERQRMVTLPPDPKSHRNYESKDWESTGLLYVRFENYFEVPVRREWNETPEKPLEGRLREILVGLFLAVEAQRRRDARFAEEERRRRESELRQYAREKRQREVVGVLQAFRDEVAAWIEARNIREYIQTCVDARDKGKIRFSVKREQWALVAAD